MKFGRGLSAVVNRLMPGKLRATTFLVANERTRQCLPTGIQGRVITQIDNCVDLSTWKPQQAARKK